jgi:cell division protein FtsB
MPSKYNSKSVRRAKTATPQWFVFAVISSITFMLCIGINFRAYSAMSRETTQFQQLNNEIEQISNENLIIQQEIHSLKSDPRSIEREARKIGMSRPNEKILVPVN